MGELLTVLNGRSHHANTLTLIVSDHGDGLGEHNYFGHAFVAYQELVHVPLLMQWPAHLPAGQRIPTPVSARRVFHTILEAAAPLPAMPNLEPDSIHSLSLRHTINGRIRKTGQLTAKSTRRSTLSKPLKTGSRTCWPPFVAFQNGGRW
ncbi:MAG: sulfatase-like hydrolase/transferase [Chloroflexi bacterium]|nr:sulfatase-like hydrolase/transferase [Chloroflexota bacterium]